MSRGSRVVPFLCLIALCVLLTSGGMNSVDGASELAQAEHFCTTGHVASSHQINADWHFHDGNWYDANDLGGMLLMVPAACISAVHGSSDPATVDQLTSVAKGIASLTYALVGGIAVGLIFLTLSEFTTLKRSWWWSLAFLFATSFLAYVKGTWSVLPAATAVAAVAWIAARSAQGRDAPRRTVYLAAAAVGAGALTRYSLFPFLLVGTVAAVYPSLRLLSAREILIAGLITLILLVPDFAYNALRTGEFWKPSQTTQPGFHVDFNYAVGTLGLFFGFEKGLLFFAPLCFLGYASAGYWAVKTTGELRWRWIVGFASAVTYAVVVCIVQDWNRFGWGPRYLIPIIPALFVAAAYLAERRPRVRPFAYMLAGLGLLSQIPLVLANWHAVAAEVGRNIHLPSQIAGLWNSALHGTTHGVGFGSATDPRALQVPDTWWWHGLQPHAPNAFGVALLVAIVASFVTYGAFLTHGSERAD